MNALERIDTTDAPAAIGPYSQAIAIGPTVYTAGQIALDPTTMELVGTDVMAQTERVFDNLDAVLRAAGTDLSHVVRATVFLADMSDFAAMNEVYERRFGGHKPARSTVAVRQLPKGGLVEIDCIAVR